MKKIGFHIDALVVIIFLFLLSFGFNFFQRYQYLDLLTEHFKIQQENTGMQFSLSMTEAQLKKCKAASDSQPSKLY